MAANTFSNTIFILRNTCGIGNTISNERNI